MKVLMLSEPNSPHTIKWATSLSSRGVEILLFGLSNLQVKNYENTSVRVFTLGQKIARKEGALSKISYLRALPTIRKIVKEFKPDILHAHYASSYGLLGALSGYHPLIVSVWGSDVFSFPNISPLHRGILKHVLKKADFITSTSHIMAKETQKYTQKDIQVIPFGVDLGVFRPKEVESLFDKGDIVIGTIKALEKTYGVEYLIRAFKIIVEKYPSLPLKLLIVGGGSLEGYLRKLTKELGIESRTIFTGRIPFDEVPKYHNMITIFVALSESESFGVAVVEAMACGKPVVVSNVGGLPEIVENNVTGFVVPPRDVKEAAKAIEKLVLDDKLRTQMGKAGMRRVKKLYDWNENVKQMIELYEKVLKQSTSKKFI